jgi:alanine dehydrogenase
MIIGIPKEGEVLKGLDEKRVALSPAGVRDLVALGAQIFVHSEAGSGAGFRSGDYRAAGAQVVYSNEEAIRRADLVLKVARPTIEELSFFNPQSALISFLHLGIPSPDLVRSMLEKKILSIGNEIVQFDDGSLPILRVSSEIAGKMAVQLAGRLLENTSGGRGVLLGGIPGIPQADVVILGGGTVGYFAARSFIGSGASVYILDHDLRRLQLLDQRFQGRVVTALANQANIEKHVAFADVLIGCAMIPGQPAPVLVREKLVEQMTQGSVIIDFSIDQGGCIETSRLTPSNDYLFTSHGVVHFCAPNVPTMVARTSSHGLSNVLLPFLREIVRDGLIPALKKETALRRGIYTLDGKISQKIPMRGFPTADLEQLINEME